ncbi:MAG: inorganic diphosphatase, partial [Flavobacteriales bacterium]
MATRSWMTRPTARWSSDGRPAPTCVTASTRRGPSASNRPCAGCSATAWARATCSADPARSVVGSAYRTACVEHIADLGGMKRILPLFLVIVLGCTDVPSPEDTSMTNLEELVASPRAGILNAVIEIPAGTVEKRQYDIDTNTFPIDLRNGQPRLIRFLPYPANYGFIPSTRMNKEEGGDGDALDVFVLCGAVPSGTVLEVEPIGIIELLDAGERDDKLV